MKDWPDCHVFYTDLAFHTDLVHLVRLAWRRLQGNLIVVFQKLKRVYKKEGEGLFIQSDSDRTRGNGFTLKAAGFRLEVTKKFFTLTVVKDRKRGPREAANVSSFLEVFRVKLDGALSNLVW